MNCDGPKRTSCVTEFTSCGSAFEGFITGYSTSFTGGTAAVVSHGLVKERVVPLKEIERAVERKKRFEADPRKHTFEEA